MKLLLVFMLLFGVATTVNYSGYCECFDSCSRRTSRPSICPSVCGYYFNKPKDKCRGQGFLKAGMGLNCNEETCTNRPGCRCEPDGCYCPLKPSK